MQAMRLINIKKRQLEVFREETAPPFAILSHTWGDENKEVKFQDFQKGTIDKTSTGWRKIEGCCQQAAKDKLEYVWIDTCCIDKTNPTEISEAINSMFRWYRRAAVCYAYLSDVPTSRDPQGVSPEFKSSRWFRRGWTLQELLAPRNLHFFNSAWQRMGSKATKCAVIQEITGVPSRFILGAVEAQTASVAQRMSWAAQRDTTKPEDLAYCLLGIFGIVMPLIYGEGTAQAFFRLQEEIMKKTNDNSILAWGLSTEKTALSCPGQSTSHKILASAPADFLNCGQIASRQVFSSLDSLLLSAGYIHTRLPLMTTSSGERFGLLNCGSSQDESRVVGIPLVAPPSAAIDEYVRSGPCRLLERPNSSSIGPLISVHMMLDGHRRMNPQPTKSLWVYEEHQLAQIGLRLVEVEPRSCWNEEIALITPVKAGSAPADRILLRFSHSIRGDKAQPLDFVVAIDAKTARCSIMTCSRSTALKDLMNRKSSLCSGEAPGENGASNGSLHLRVVPKEVEERLFSVKPEVMSHPPAKGPTQKQPPASAGWVWGLVFNVVKWVKPIH